MIKVLITMSIIMILLKYLLKYLLLLKYSLTKTGPQTRRRSMILKKSSTRLLHLIPRLQRPILLDIQMMLVKKLLVQRLHHQVTSRPHQLILRMLTIMMRRITKTGPQRRHQSMIPKIRSTRLLLLIPRLQWSFLLDIQMMLVKKLLVEMLHHQVTSRPHQMVLMMVQVQHRHDLVGKIWHYNPGLGKENRHDECYQHRMIRLRIQVIILRMMHDQQQHQLELVGKILHFNQG